MNVQAAKTHPNVAVLLTLSGGFLDAFTYIGHGKVFANSMTGNIVLLAVNLAAGNWQQVSRHISPIVGFVCGVLAAHLLQLMTPRRVRHPASGSRFTRVRNRVPGGGCAEGAAGVLADTGHLVRRDASNDVLHAFRKTDLHVGDDHRKSAAVRAAVF